MFMFIHNSRRGVVRSFGKHVQYSNCKCYFIHRSTAWIIWCTFEDFHIKTSFQRLFAGGGGGGDRESMWNFRLFRFRYLSSWLRYSRHLVFCLSQRFHGTQLYHCRISYLNTWSIQLCQRLFSVISSGGHWVERLLSTCIVFS